MPSAKSAANDGGMLDPIAKLALVKAMEAHASTVIAVVANRRRRTTATTAAAPMPGTITAIETARRPVSTTGSFTHTAKSTSANASVQLTSSRPVAVGPTRCTTSTTRSSGAVGSALSSSSRGGVTGMGSAARCRIGARLRGAGPGRDRPIGWFSAGQSSAGRLSKTAMRPMCAADARPTMAE